MVSRLLLGAGIALSGAVVGGAICLTAFTDWIKNSKEGDDK